ncbi:MAG: ParA family protein [Solirubrobacteraceae bacterium]
MENGNVSHDAEAIVIVLANHKGGVTKTTSTANLAALLAESGKRVLMVDCDPQANLSRLYGWTEDKVGERLEDLLANAPSRLYVAPEALQPDVAQELAWRDQLRIIPCSRELADVASELPANGAGYELAIKEIIDAQRGSYDYIVIDTPPGLVILSGMALLAADYLLIPTQPADLDVGGAGDIYDLVEEQAPHLQILGVLIARSDRRWRITREAADRISLDRMKVLPMQIPNATRVASAPRHRAPTAILEPDSRVSSAYRDLATLVLQETAR